MSKEEMEKKLEEQQKQIDARKAQVKKQNERAKELWDTVSCRFPVGTKDRIKAHGETVNGFLNRLVISELNRLDGAREADQRAKEQLERANAEYLATYGEGEPLPFE
jgi:hypothetical protein